jgi:valyl-tRNA synthetase
MSHEEPDNLPYPPQPEQQTKSSDSPSAAQAGAPSAAALPKAYDPSIIEQRWAEYWVRERIFDVPTPDSAPGQRKTFSLLLPPPNVTGRLHMGHMLNQTEIDILMRWHRMCGDRTLWVPGTDHAGIATQMMVERQLAAEGTDRKALGREAFTERVWTWKRQYGSAITDQMRRLGASVDWSREFFTMDDRLNVAVTEAFVRLWEQGLIYRGAYIVNWDSVLQSAVSDLEVESEERIGKLYLVRYPFAGAMGPFDETNSVVVATTRPETMLGDVAVAVNPKDARYKHLIGVMLQLPLTRREIPIIADNWANPEFGTGAVKVTPAHDPNDFAIGQRHGLPSLSILDKTAHVDLPGSPFHGLDRYEARDVIVAQLDSLGVLVQVKDHPMTVPVSQRSGAVIEPRLSDQWFLAVNKTFGGRPSIAQTAIDAVKDGHIKFTPSMYEKTYMEWMTNIHDWCISRQLWWGHRIPAWYCDSCKQVIVARTAPTACAKCRCKQFTQETDVLDTWFSSGLLPFTVFGWPNTTEESQAVEIIRETARGEGKYIRQVGGVGNYAHVKLRISPNVRGGGLAFSNEVDSHTLPERFIQPIQEGIKEAMRGGIVEGHPLADIKVSLIDGSYHEIDSNETAFHVAASIALREAARKANAVPVDPASSFEISHVSAHGNLLTIEPQTSNLTPDLAAFYPTSLLITGFDILFFWVARMTMLSCHFMLEVPMPDGSPRLLADAVPFREVYIHSLVRDANREKMSKTKGNVIDPIEIIERFGTDAVRFTLASMASPGTDIAFSEARTEGNRAFANKIWNAARFLFMNLDRAREAGIGFSLPNGSGSRPTWGLSAESPLESSWILTRLSQTAAAVNSCLVDYRFDEAANHVYQFFWGELCDWYLEIVKLRLNFDEGADRAATSAALTTLVAVFESALRLLSPFMPFLTEEIWHALYAGAPPAKSIALIRYPQATDFPRENLGAAYMKSLQEFITLARYGRKQAGVPEKQYVPFRFSAKDDVREIIQLYYDPIIASLIRSSELLYEGPEPLGGNAVSAADFDIEPLYEREIDIPAERERLTRDLAKYEKGLIAAERQLGNEAFMAKAPAHIVEGLCKQAAETRTLYDKAKAALDALG